MLKPDGMIETNILMAMKDREIDYLAVAEAYRFCWDESIIDERTGEIEDK